MTYDYFLELLKVMERNALTFTSELEKKYKEKRRAIMQEEIRIAEAKKEPLSQQPHSDWDKCVEEYKLWEQRIKSNMV